MRPLHLTIQGFGPFREKQTINFQEGMEFLLITGKTGSGKTTIFDAIMFCLFGKLPGTREENSIVSSLLEPGEVPFVELDFTLKGKMYRVYRQPAHMRPSRRKSDAYTKEAAVVNLFTREESGWEPRQGTMTEINEYLGELMGLSDEEFSKIVLLPQGEFQKFLMADTQEKRELLQKIFPTTMHEAVAAHARKKKNERQQELKLKREQLDHLLNEFDHDAYVENEKILEEKIREEVEACRRLQDDIEKQNARVTRAEKEEEDFLELEKIRVRENELKNRREEMEKLSGSLQRIREGEGIFPLLEEHKRLDENLKELEKALKEAAAGVKSAAKDFRDAEKKRSSLPVMEKDLQKCREEAGRLKELLPKVKLFAVKNQDLDSLQKKGARIAADHEKESMKEKGLQGEIEELNRLLVGKTTIENEFRKSFEKLKGLQDALKRAEDHRKISGEIRELEANNRLLHDELVKNNKILEINQGRVLELKAKRDAAVTASLAAELVDGSPCPVCGSTSHPAPAGGDGAIDVTEDLLAAENNLRLSLQEEARIKEGISRNDSRHGACLAEAEKTGNGRGSSPEDLSREINTVEGEQKSLEKEMEKLQEKQEEKDKIEGRLLLVRKDLSLKQQELTAAREEYAGLKREVAILEKETGKGGDIETLLKGAEEKIASGSAAIEGIREFYQKSESLLRELSAREKTLQGELDKSTAQMEKHQQDINRRLEKTSFNSVEEVKSLQRESKSAAEFEKEINDYREEFTRVVADIEILEKRTGKKKRPDLEALRRVHGELKEKLARHEEERRRNENSHRDLRQQKKQYDTLNKDLESIIRDTELLVSLADDLNGRNPRNINFQNFILGAYLREVTAHATSRFNLMSNGRYSIMVNEEIEHRGRQAGLELDVFDSFSGKLRSVKTLSGGEKFLAAISLSLGLADVIQERSGGIELDAIFIDEGFGSLDEESLDRALTILDDIRQNRLVGIISHVPELKNRIPGQLEVVKGSSGSRIR